MDRSVTFLNGEEIILSGLLDDSKGIDLCEKLQVERPLPSSLHHYKINSGALPLQDEEIIGPRSQFSAVIEMRFLSFEIHWQRQIHCFNSTYRSLEILSVRPETDDLERYGGTSAIVEVPPSDAGSATDEDEADHNGTSGDDSAIIEIPPYDADSADERHARGCEISGHEVLHRLLEEFGAPVPGLCDMKEKRQILSYEERLDMGGFLLGPDEDDLLSECEVDENHLRMLREMLESTASGRFFDLTDHYRNSVKRCCDRDLQFRVAGHIISYSFSPEYDSESEDEWGWTR